MLQRIRRWWAEQNAAFYETHAWDGDGRDPQVRHCRCHGCGLTQLVNRPMYGQRKCAGCGTIVSSVFHKTKEIHG